MFRFYIPSSGVDDWRQLLIVPETQWKKGYSARAFAYSWVESEGIPEKVKEAFSMSDEVQLRKIEPIIGIPEHKVPLEGGLAPSQNDLFLLARAGSELVSITVEGKVSESFDRPVEDWLVNASEGKKTRLNYLCALLGLEKDSVKPIRYQLLHRTASAIIEAKRFNAKFAVMIVHSFSQTHLWFEDFENFVTLYGQTTERGEVKFLKEINGVRLFAGWITGNKKYLTK